MARSGSQREYEPAEDVDRVFGHLSMLPPPRGFAGAVLRSVAELRPARLDPVWLAAAAASILAVLVLGYLAGQALVGGGLLVLLSTLVVDSEILGLAPAETLLAVLDLVPWIELVGVGLALALFGVTLRRVGRSARAETAASVGVAT